jgi:hypothetical protein
MPRPAGQRPTGRDPIATGGQAGRQSGGSPRRPKAVLFDLYDTLVHAAPHNSFYRAVPSALGVAQERWLACYRVLGPAAMLGELPDMTSRVHLACHRAGQPRDRTRWPRLSATCCPCSTRA